MGSDSSRGDGVAGRKRGPKPRTDVRQRADKLVRQAGIPTHYAFLVARGEMTLNEALQKMALKDKVESLIGRHDLPRSLATQVAMGQADLDRVLQKRRLESHLEKWREHSSLATAVEHGRPMLLSLHDKRWCTGTVRSVDRYEVVLDTDDGEQTVHKLQVKLAVEAAHARDLRRAVKRDKGRDAPTEPIWKPQDRYGCSDKRLFGYFDEATPIQVTTLEGDVIVGTVAWMGRWEFGLTLKKSNAPVTVFRHALADLRSA